MNAQSAAELRISTSRYPTRTGSPAFAHSHPTAAVQAVGWYGFRCPRQPVEKGRWFSPLKVHRLASTQCGPLPSRLGTVLARARRYTFKGENVIGMANVV
ncbi:hypothetical protein GCM10009764_41550 [Nocardia ninae]|uniref:Uncharacterized protein n=1 Tax=Nocardia ninae NBRC 108245 TaxID=1210091 RepID=A0A511MA92_9NOCA|nr:hypothetical protein NN4_20920 [Nocardia ninae NBRC 108245]